MMRVLAILLLLTASAFARPRGPIRFEDDEASCIVRLPSLYDTAAGGLAITNVGMTTGPGKVGDALVCTNAYITLGSVSTFAFIQNTTNFTLSVWVRMNLPFGNSFVAVAASTVASTERGFYLALDNRVASGFTNAVSFASVKGTSGQNVSRINKQNTDVLDGRWHHIVVAANSLFIDGELAAVSDKYDGLSTGNSTRLLNIGRYNYSTPGGPLWGEMCDFRIYSNSWTAAKVRVIYNGGR